MHSYIPHCHALLSVVKGHVLCMILGLSSYKFITVLSRSKLVSHSVIRSVIRGLCLCACLFSLGLLCRNIIQTLHSVIPGIGALLDT